MINWLIDFILGMGSKRHGALIGTPTKLGFRKGTWVAVAIGGSALIGGGVSLYQSKKAGEGDDYDPLQSKQLPEYPEAEGARADWWNKIQEFGGQPGYGAIAPDWGDIWERARGKVSRYYSGGPLTPGLKGKVKASTARRNVSESPAQEELLTRIGQEEGLQLKDLASEQALQEAQFGEAGRQNWLQQIQALSGQKPSFVTGTGTAPGSSGSDLGSSIMDLGGTAGKLLGQKQQQNWYQQMMNQSQYGGFGGAPGTTGDVGSYLGKATPPPVNPNLYS